MPCTDCKGQGEIFNKADLCKVCKGEKVLKKTKTLEVALDPGVPNDHDYI